MCGGGLFACIFESVEFLLLLLWWWSGSTCSGATFLDAPFYCGSNKHCHFFVFDIFFLHFQRWPMQQKNRLLLINMLKKAGTQSGAC